MKQYSTAITKALTNPKIQFLLVFAMIFQRYLFFGQEYYPQLDDFIQHHNYSKYPDYTGNSIWTLIENTGMFSFRPLAGVLDLTLWTALFPQMIVGVALISLLYAGSAILFYHLLGKFFPCSPLFLVIYTMIPLGFEGTYWMSASTRIVPGLFFTALSAWFFHDYCTTGNKKLFWYFFLSQVISFGFYEQTMILSLTFTGLLMIYHFFHHRKRCFTGFAFLGSLGIYLAVTKSAASAAMYSSRSEIILPSDYYFQHFLPDLLQQFYQAYLQGGFYTIYRGFFRGWEIIQGEKGYLYLLVAVVLTVFLGFLPDTREKVSSSKKKTIISALMGVFIGFILLLAPISAFFIIANPWFSLRGTVASFCGIALLIDSAISLCLVFFPREDLWKKLVTLPLALVCFVAAVSELSDYRHTYLDDLQVVSAIYPYIESLETSKKVGILGVERSFLPEQNFEYHEHLHGVTESDWALTGRMGEYADGNTSTLVPLPLETPAYFHYNASGKRLDLFDLLLYYQHDTGNVTPLRLEVVTPEEYYLLYDEDGNYVGSLSETEGKGVVTLEKEKGFPE